MQKKLLEKDAAKAYQKNEEIIDIILFGSAARNKTNPKDTDVLILTNRKTVNELKQYHPIIKTYKEFIHGFPTESILTEGRSLIFKKAIAELYHMKPAFLFRYSLKKKSSSERMKFYYALHGRTTKCMLKETKSHKFSQETIITPTEHADLIKEFFEVHKIEYFFVPLLYPKTYEGAEQMQ